MIKVKRVAAQNFGGRLDLKWKEREILCTQFKTRIQNEF